MAEHMNQTTESEIDGFNAMGKPIPEHRKSEAYKQCKAMGLSQARAMECVNGLSEQLERDQPYEAQATGMRHLDLTGTYRIMAVLLTHPRMGSPQEGEGDE